MRAEAVHLLGYRRFLLPGTIRGLVILTAILALLPALVLVVYSDYTGAETALEDIRVSASAITRRVAASQEQAVENTRILLTTLAATPEVRGRNAEDLHALFSRIVRQSELYPDLRLHDRLGNILASAHETPPHLLEEERNQIRQAFAHEGFALFELPHENAYDAPVMHCLYPVRQNGLLLGMLAAPVYMRISATDLAGLAAEFMDTVQLADMQGNVIFGLPERTVGQSDDEDVMHPLWGRVLARPDARGRILLKDGSEVFFEKIFIDGGTHPQLTVFFNATLPGANAIMRKSLSRSMAWFLAATLLALGVVWRVCSKTIVRPSAALLQTARGIREGDLSARAEAKGAARELALLADSVNSMARSLESRGNELMAASRAAQAANQAKTDFLATMSHEIRTPMNAILGMTYLSRQGELTEQQRGYLDHIYDQAGKLLKVINDILDFSKMEAGKFQVESLPFAPAPLLDEVAVKAARAAHEKGLAFKPDITPFLPPRLLGDGQHLRQVLDNLLAKAVQYTESGEVGFACMVQRPAPPALELVFEISDSAGGMSTFERLQFFPDEERQISPSSYEDSSLLSLAVTRRLVRLMQGSLAVRSSPGSGSVVALRLPFFETTDPLPDTASPQAASPEAAMPEAISPEAALPEAAMPVRTGAARTADGTQKSVQDPLPLDGMRILLVDDNIINQQIAEEILNGLGASVQTASNGIEALEALGADGGGYRLVLMDLQMPVMDGFAATTRIRERPELADLPVIAMSAQSREEEWGRCREAGMNDFVPKPVDVPGLVAAVRRWTG